jgi:hypothetical protein
MGAETERIEAAGILMVDTRLWIRISAHFKCDRGDVFDWLTERHAWALSTRRFGRRRNRDR